MTVIKLCGLRDEAAVRTVNEMKTEYAGFICSRPFRRYVDFDTLRRLKELLSPAVSAVGVFVNEPLDLPAALARERLIDVIQLHGTEDNRYIDLLREKVSCPIIQAVKIDSFEAVTKAEQSHADLILADGGCGEGKTFDHSFLHQLKRSYILAGGLNPDNVRHLIRTFRPYGVDTSSGIETSGIKDPEKMRTFVRHVREAENE